MGQSLGGKRERQLFGLHVDIFNPGVVDLEAVCSICQHDGVAGIQPDGRIVRPDFSLRATLLMGKVLSVDGDQVMGFDLASKGGIGINGNRNA